jgi:hypothetical protein
MLSLAKLALLASVEEPDKVEVEMHNLNTDLDLVSYQEELPEIVLSAYGYDVERLRVLTPTELVKVRTGIHGRSLSLALKRRCNYSMPSYQEFNKYFTKAQVSVLLNQQITLTRLVFAF